MHLKEPFFIRVSENDEMPRNALAITNIFLFQFEAKKTSYMTTVRFSFRKYIVSNGYDQNISVTHSRNFFIVLITKKDNLTNIFIFLNDNVILKIW